MNQEGLVSGKQQFEYPEQDPDFMGKELDQSLQNGPIEDRGCKDVFWCILFIIMFGGLIATSVYAFKNGNPGQLLSPYSTLQVQGGQQVQCGQKTQYYDTSDYPYLYLNSSNNEQNTYCVSQCPTYDGQLLNVFQQGQLGISNYVSLEILSICYPLNQTIAKEFQNLLQISDVQESIADIKNSWPIQAGNLLIAVIFALILTVLIRYTASCLVWSSIFLYLASLVGLGVLCFETATNPYWNLRLNTNNNSQNNNLLLGLAYTFWVFAGLSLLLLICVIKKVALAIAVMKAAADFTRDVWEAAFVPLGVYGFIIGFIVYWVYVTLYLVSCGQIQPSYSSGQVDIFGSVQWNTGVGWLIAYDVFSLYWIANFVMGFAQFVIASACAMWYFSHLGNNDHLSHPISKSICRGLWHHGGSIALGSLILAFVGLIRVIMDQIHKAMKTSVMNNHGVVEGCAKCWFGYCNYILKCFERFIRFLTQNAYIMIAINGESFCTAAHEAFYLIQRNLIKVAVTHGIGEIFTVIGNLFIGFSSAIIGYIMLTNIEYFQHNVISPFIPTLIILIVALIIGSLFMNVYGMGVDTILLCYIADSELYRHEGGAKSIPPSLKEFLAEYK